MTAGRLRAVVCTSSLDLGIDWGDVDLVINVGAPKGASRLLQRIGRANHRLDEPSKGVLVPANRFEVLECRAALGAVAENAQDTPPARTGALDVLAQHVLGSRLRRAVPRRRALRRGARAPRPMPGSRAPTSTPCVDFVATGGYALKAYERFAKIRQGKDGRWRVSHPMVAQRYRMNVGTIVEADMLKVRLVRSRASKMIPRGGRLLGEVEEYFIETLTPGDTFVFAGEILQLRGAGRGRGLCLARGFARIPRCRPTRAASFRSRPISPTACARIFADHDALARAAGAGARMAGDPGMALAAAAAARPAGRDLSARRQALSGLLSVRGPARAPDARHAADAPAGARAAAAARLRRQRICAGGLGPRRRRAARSSAASSRSPRCSTRTCWATISRPGSPNPR